MRRAIVSILFLVLALGLWGCGGSAPRGLAGTWELVSPVPDSAASSGPLIKVLNDTHFAFGRTQEDGSIWAGGGTYTFDGTTYTEAVVYHSIGSLVGMTIRFTDRLDGDRWYHQATFDAGGRSYDIDEVWKRID